MEIYYPWISGPPPRFLIFKGWTFLGTPTLQAPCCGRLFHVIANSKYNYISPSCRGVVVLGNLTANAELHPEYLSTQGAYIREDTFSRIELKEA